MDPFSLAIGGKFDTIHNIQILARLWPYRLSCTIAVGFADVATRLAISCFKLYEFWESLQGAPAAVQIIKTDLVLLNNVLQDLSDKADLAPSVTMVLKSCQAKVEVSPTVVIRLQHLCQYPATVHTKTIRHSRQSLPDLTSRLS
jgi:hypothetical protein